MAKLPWWLRGADVQWGQAWTDHNGNNFAPLYLTIPKSQFVFISVWVNLVDRLFSLTDRLLKIIDVKINNRLGYSRWIRRR